MLCITKHLQGYWPIPGFTTIDISIPKNASKLSIYAQVPCQICNSLVLDRILIQELGIVLCTFCKPIFREIFVDLFLDYVIVAESGLGKSILGFDKTGMNYHLRILVAERANTDWKSKKYKLRIKNGK